MLESLSVFDFLFLYIVYILISNVSNIVMKTFLWKAENKFTSRYMNIQKVLFFQRTLACTPAGAPFALLLPIVYLQIAPFERWGNQFLLAGFISPNFSYPKVGG